MRIAIASLGRFHVLDLGRELAALGADVAFYSYVPKRRALRFGLPGACHRGLLPAVAPLLLWQHKLPRLAPGLQERAMAHALDAAVIARMTPCDVFICMSGMYLAAARHAKQRYGARIYLERGSQHIRAQRRLMRAAGAARGPSDFIVARECAGYELADRIVVPSTPVVESFLNEAPHLAGKLFVNPYGVDLELFPQRSPVDGPGQASGRGAGHRVGGTGRTIAPTAAVLTGGQVSGAEKVGAEGAAPTAGRAAGPARALFVGAWSLRKGVDVLMDAVRRLPGVRLTHVGGPGDLPFPVGDAQFETMGPVPQWQLAAHYARADLFVLASREEGLALVQPQALVSGLPLVCTTRTGGADLALSPELARRIRAVPPEDAAALAEAMTAVLAETGLAEIALRTADAAAAGAGAKRYLGQDEGGGQGALSADVPGTGAGWPPLPDADRRLLSWAAYGARYRAELWADAGLATAPRPGAGAAREMGPSAGAVPAPGPETVTETETAT